MNCNVISSLKKLPDYAELSIPNESELLKAELERFRLLKISWMTEYTFYLHFINSLSKNHYMSNYKLDIFDVPALKSCENTKITKQTNHKRF